MAFNELPEEILVRILSFLPPSDRLESALTCRRWAQAVGAPPLTRDVQLVIEGFQGEEAGTIFANSQRQYENLQLHRDSLSEFNAAFWTNIGPSLRNLEMIGYKCSAKVFYSVLQACSNLESLMIGKFLTLPPLKKSDLPPGMIIQNIRKSMQNLRHLHLDFVVNAEMLENLFILMPNVSSIALSHYERSDFLGRLPDILGTRRITRLKINRNYGETGGDELELLRISSASLRKLKYYEDTPTPEVISMLRNCTMLRHLNIKLGYRLDSRLLRNIPRDVPELESLVITIHPSGGGDFTWEDLMPIFDLRRLRNLQLSIEISLYRRSLIPLENLREFTRMLSLESLTVGGSLGFVDSTGLRLLLRLPNLRSLEIGNLQWDVECLETVLFDLRKLRAFVAYNHLYNDDRYLMFDERSEPEREITAIGHLEPSSLKVLKLFNIPLTDACLGHITAYHTQLRTVFLYISDCDDITDHGLVTLLHHEPLLEKLEVISRKTMNGSLLEALGELCPRLRLLRIYPRPANGSQAQDELKLRRPRVKLSFLLDPP